MMGSISEALISLIPEKISETAPGRTPMAAARPPLDLPVFFSPRSIILESMYMVTSPFRFSIHSEFHNEINAVFQKNNLTVYSVYRNRGEGGWQASRNGNDTVESAGWPSSHCEALREFVTQGMSYRDAA